MLCKYKGISSLLSKVTQHVCALVVKCSYDIVVLGHQGGRIGRRRIAEKRKEGEVMRSDLTSLGR